MWPQHQYHSKYNTKVVSHQSLEFHYNNHDPLRLVLIPPNSPNETLNRHHNAPREPTASSSSARASRNFAEKQRRDNLNSNIAMMAALVPTIIGSSRRQDKISILRLAGAYLRTNFTIGPGTPGFIPPEYSDIDLEDSFIDASEGNGGFLIIVTTTGSIIYVGRRIEGQLGHIPTELIGRSLYSYVHQDDHEELAKALAPGDVLSSIMEARFTDQNSNSSDSSSSSETEQDHSFADQRRNFNIKFAQRTNSRNEHTQFKYFSVSGVLKVADYCQKKMNPKRNVTSNDVIFVGIARMMHKRITELSLFEANKQEYVTRHLLDGRIIFSDHRIAVVAGYMAEEVSGTNAFGFMHKEDVRYTVMALKQMYDQRQGYGASCYRLLSKSGSFIYLRTHGYLELDKTAGTFASFICVNTLVEKEEGDALIKELKGRFAATTSKEEAAMVKESLPSPDSQANVEDRTQLEDVISRLMSDLPSPVALDEQYALSPAPDINFAKAVIYSKQMPPVSVQTNLVGIKDVEIPGKGKHKCIKEEPNCSPSSEQLLHVNAEVNATSSALNDLSLGIISPNRQNTVTNYDSSNNDDKNNFTVNPEPIISGSIIINNGLSRSKRSSSKSYQKHSLRGNNLYDTIAHSSDLNSTIVSDEPSELRLTGDCASNFDGILPCSTSVSTASITSTDGDCHSEDTRSRFVTMKSKVMDHDLEQQGIKRPFEEDDDLTFDKKQRHEFHMHKEKSLDASIQHIMEEHPDLLKMIDELGEVIKADTNIINSNIEKLPSHQVDQTLRRTYSRLKDHMNYQGAQMDELELVFDNEDLYPQKENLEQLQAEREIQRKIMKTLQRDHRSMQVNVKENIGV